ncbi:hypothetical protein J5N97_024715 [Dioscorea zingiberensis]|uniref:Uncharacterized protein n=1 Tax=Dioscorea zingiberensis TaxID=325984 RepID=A0A9D5C7S7_9LILI|nr:hypothetical protein J5N97_024715 [Dioscorea zingiberensis]
MWPFICVDLSDFCGFCVERLDDPGSYVDSIAAEYSPFLGIEKGAVLQEARVFHDPQLDAGDAFSSAISSQLDLLVASLEIFDDVLWASFLRLVGHHKTLVFAKSRRNIYKRLKPQKSSLL